MDIQDRTREVVELFKKLNGLNLGITGFEEFDEFRKICNNFIRTGEYSKGSIKVFGTKRVICYELSDKVECVLKYDESV